MTESIQEFSDRKSLLHANSVLISQLQSRLKAKRWRPQEGENLKISYMRVLIQSLACQNQLLRDSELDQVKIELEELRELVVKNQSCNQGIVNGRSK